MYRRKMYEELISRLLSLSKIDAIQQEPEICRITMDCIGAIKEIAIEAADAIETMCEMVATAHNVIQSYEENRPHWFPATETPPLKVGDKGYNGYLVFANGYYEIADYTTDKFDNVPYFHVNGEYETDVTHWMPLPEPPKDEKSEEGE